MRGRAASRPSRRTLLVFAGVWVAVAALVVTGVLVSKHGGAADPAGTYRVATLDGQPVTRDELLFHLRRLAPSVQNELRNEFQLTGTIDWTDQVGDQTALHRLTTRALEQLRHDRTLLALAREQGLVDSVGYADFLTELADENRSRAEAIANGQTVYGLAEFSPEEYWSRRLTELTTSLKERLGGAAGGPLQVTDAEVRQEFEADREAWSANATTYAYTRLVVPVPDGAGADFGTDLGRRVAGADRLAEVAAGAPGARLTVDTYQGGGAANPYGQELAAVLGGLTPGQISAPVPGSGQITYYQLDDRRVDEDAAFADYSRRIRQSLVDRKFDKYLQRRVDDTNLWVDTAAVDAIKAKDVQQ